MASRVKSSRRGPAPAKARRSSRQAAISSAGGRTASWRTKVMTRSTPYSSPPLRASERPSVEEKRVADLQLHARGGELAFAEHPQRHTGGLDAQRAALPD